jgi:tetratricopeptide (TPR) repeat protein
MKKTFHWLVAATTFIGFVVAASAADAVKLFEQDEVIPTYKSGPPEPNPMFYFGRDSQGAEGRTYPYPLYDNLTNVRSEQSYHLIYLENEYVKIAIAPEIGGRLFSALDKTDNYDFVYHQHVIKPALIGLIGAWISGGIEWNIPHHHRASTFLPVQYRTEENADGSKTVWVGELEVRQRMRWAVGYTLRPGSSVLECSVRIINRTPLPYSMLCFANVAVNANDDYQIIFPPDTQWVTYHAKREFSQWPISHQRYSGADFTAGVDVSWYKNHFNANSMFAWNYTDDFFAGYDHGKNAGTMSIADHHIVPGKKFWTWGNGPRGRMWDDILTDTDGPYIELMVGAYSDNQPDYSWLQPFEERSFTMNWYPFRDIGGVKNANLEAAVNLEIIKPIETNAPLSSPSPLGGERAGVRGQNTAGQSNAKTAPNDPFHPSPLIPLPSEGRGNSLAVKFGFYTTKEFPNAIVRLKAGDKILVEERISINPAKPYTKQIAVPAGVDEHDVRASLSVDGREIVAYSPVRLTPMAQPAVVAPPLSPKAITNEEELFLAGLRIDQFHNPTLDADPYWEEAVKRDPGDIEANTGLGLLNLRNAKFADAEQHFRKALERLTAKYTSPKNAEPFYYLGVALAAQDKTDEAFDAFYKAAWSQEWKSPAYFSLAEIASMRGDFVAALNYVNNSLDANALNVRAYGLKIAALRHLNRTTEAREVLEFALRKTDPLDVGLLAEKWLLTRDESSARELLDTLNQFPTTAQEVAAEFSDAGLWLDGSEVLEQSIAAAPDKSKTSPVVYYYYGDFAEKLGDAATAKICRQFAAQQPPDYVFPFQSEVIGVLRRAMAANPLDARAPYYLGNLLFDWQPAEAIALWEKSAALDPSFPITWRNLAQAYSHKDDEASRAKAISYLEKAVALDDNYPAHYSELDQLYQAAGVPVEKRLALLEQHQQVVVKKDEGLAALIGLKTFAGKSDEAIALLQGRTFSLWEGGTRFNTGEAWADAHLVRGLQRFSAKQYREALADFDAALKPPANLRAEQRGGSRQAELAYWIGCANEGLGNSGLARQSWTTATVTNAPATGNRRGGNALGARASRYFQALAFQKLGQNDKAEAVFHELVDAGTAALRPADDDSTISSRQPANSRAATAHYITGLGCAGLGEKENARKEFAAALASSPDHLGAKIALEQLNVP